MATIETLQHQDNSVIYPVTKTEAVYNGAGTETLNTTLTAINTALSGKADTSSAAGDADKFIKADGTKSTIATANIADGAVTTAKIADNSITKDKIATSAVTTDKINYSANGATLLSTTGIDLNSGAYLTPGRYYCDQNSIGSTFLNNPSGNAFTMFVVETISTKNVPVGQLPSGSWFYYYRILFEATGNNVFFQQAGVDSQGVITFTAWKKVSHQNTTLTTVDPGAGSDLADGQFIAVYEA